MNNYWLFKLRQHLGYFLLRVGILEGIISLNGDMSWNYKIKSPRVISAYLSRKLGFEKLVNKHIKGKISKIYIGWLLKNVHPESPSMCPSDLKNPECPGCRKRRLYYDLKWYKELL